MSVVAAAGFRAAGVAAGIKPSGDLDLALVAADQAVPAAAVFTVSTAAAPPVTISRRHLAAGAAARAVVVNSGCANAGTGAGGERDALAMADLTARGLGCGSDEVIVCSTGPIGPRLPMAALERGTPAAVAALSSHPAAGTAAARAILTTDTRPKEALARGGGWVVGGMAKGAGMLRPDMATMLAVLTTDAAIGAADLHRALAAAVDVSFHALNVDGCMSTNDTVAILASGASGVSPDPGAFAAAVGEVCRTLAAEMAADAEGASRVVLLRVVGAGDDATARALGRAAADSALVRSSFHGGDPNWGRILGALGASGLPFDPAAMAVRYEGVEVAADGVAVPCDTAALVAKLTGLARIEIDLTVGDGPGTAEVLTTDLTPDYVRFNAEPS